MTKTVLLVRLDHAKPLPAETEKMVRERIFWLLYSFGVEAVVSVTVDKPLEVREPPQC